MEPKAFECGLRTLRPIIQIRVLQTITIQTTIAQTTRTITIAIVVAIVATTPQTTAMKATKTTLSPTFQMLTTHPLTINLTQGKRVRTKPTL